MRETFFYSDWNYRTYHRYLTLNLRSNNDMIRFIPEGIAIEYYGNPFDLKPLKHYKPNEI